MRAAVTVVLAAILALILLVPPAPGNGSAPVRAFAPRGAVPATNLTNLTNYTLVNYSSSVDGTNLSYYEWLPANYTSSQRYPLAVYLHGLGYNGSELFTLVSGLEAIQNASTMGFVLISLNTRTPAGFYVNSPYSGPQEQDVLDAIAHEEARRSINSSAVYLFGSSMGTIGAYSIAGHHPGLIRGIGAIAECPEVFMATYYHALIGQSGAYLSTTGGYAPNQSAYALGQTYYLDAVRYFPQNYSHLLMYAVQGGADDRCPNNLALFGYQQSNNTFLNATCLTLPNWSQPASCQTPFVNLSAAHPGEYRWRFVYEPRATHSLNDLDPLDMFRFWQGTEPPGLFCAPMGGTPFACPGSPTVTAPTASPVLLDAGSPLELSEAAYGGTPPLTYSWTGLPPGCASVNASSLTCVPVSPGTFTVVAGVTDVNGSQVASPGTTIVVRPALGLTLSAVPSSGPPPLSVAFRATVEGGTAPFAVAWAFGDGERATGANVSHTYVAAGVYTVRATVNDSLGASVNRTTTVVVGSTPLQLQGPTATPASIDLGQEVDFGVGVVNGTSLYRYAWNGLPTGCPTINASTVPCVPSATGAFSVSVTVQDLVGDTATAGPLAFSVVPDPGPPTLVASRSVLDVGQSSTLALSLSGGAAPYAIVWSGLPPGCAGTASTLECAPTAPGAYGIGAEATDANGLLVAAPALQLEVNPRLVVGALDRDPTTPVAGRPLTLTATFSGGTPPFEWSYGDLPPGCASQNASTLSCLPSAAGTYAIDVGVTDAVGGAANASLTLVVAPAGSPSVGSGPTSLAWWGIPLTDWAIGIGGALAVALAALFLRRRRPR